jgi:hypothetical protein
MHGRRSTAGLPTQLHFSGNLPMAFDFHHSTHDEKPILIPQIGLTLRVRVPPETTGGALTAIETVNAPGYGPPLHRHRETEIFYVQHPVGRLCRRRGDRTGWSRPRVRQSRSSARAPVHPDIAGARREGILPRLGRSHARWKAGQGRAEPFRKKVAGRISWAASPGLMERAAAPLEGRCLFEGMRRSPFCARLPRVALCHSSCAVSRAVFPLIQNSTPLSAYLPPSAEGACGSETLPPLPAKVSRTDPVDPGALKTARNRGAVRTPVGRFGRRS